MSQGQVFKVKDLSNLKVLSKLGQLKQLLIEGPSQETHEK